MAGRQSPDSRSYTNGDILSQQQFTDVILSQENIGALSLTTMSYGIPLNEISNARSVHAKLLSLADGRNTKGFRYY